MLNGILKEDQIHGRQFVIVERQCAGENFLNIGNALDRPVLGIADAVGKVAVRKKFHLRVVLPCGEFGLDGDVAENFVVQVNVLLPDQLVAVDAGALVHPQLHQVVFGFDHFRPGKP